MNIEVPDSAKRMMIAQQSFIKNNKVIYNSINRHNEYLLSVYNRSHIQYINSAATKYDSLINVVGGRAYITNSPTYNFYKSDYYKNLYTKLPNLDSYIPNFYKYDYHKNLHTKLPNLDSYIPNFYKYDFRIKIQSQKLVSKIELIAENLNDISEPKINDIKVKFDEFISEPLVNTTYNNNHIDDNTDMRSMIAEIYKSQKRQEKTFYEEIKNREQNNPSEQSDDKSFNIIQSFLLPLFAVLGVISVPKDAYESIIWYIEIISELIDLFF